MNEDNLDEKQSTRSHQPEDQNEQEFIDQGEDKEKNVEPPKKVVREDKLSEEEESYKSRLIRITADFENYKKRQTKERSTIITQANERLLKSIIVILDDLNRAKKEDEGVNLIYKKFLSILEKEGLKEIELKTGDDYNIDEAEAITKVENKELGPDKVLEVVEKGYKLNTHVIRYAKVIIT